jgi:hypothetical protein
MSVGNKNDDKAIFRVRHGGVQCVWKCAVVVCVILSYSPGAGTDMTLSTFLLRQGQK